MRNMTISAMLLGLVFVASPARAQDSAAVAPPRDSACSYRECALGIAPTWNGLVVVRGTGGPRVANLHFFWPADISPALRGDPHARGADSAAASAKRAISLRRVGAALTDNDAARANKRPAGDFEPQPLAVRIAAVAAGTLTFLMSHDATSNK